jgi:hypothetical protein
VVTNQATTTIFGSLVVSGSITNDGGGTITDKGFEYSLTSSVLNNPTKTPTNSQGNTFTTTYNSSGITIYYRAYATNSAGTGYGVIRSYRFP